MTQEEKKLLQRAQLEIEHLILLLHPEVHVVGTQKEPTVEQLQEMLDCLRVLVKYQKFDLEATQRERALLEKALRDKQ